MPSCPLLMSPCHPQHLPQGHRPRLSEATRSHRALGAAQSSSPAPGCTFPLQSHHTDRPCQCPELPLDPRLAGGGSRGLPTAAGFCSHHECSVGMAVLLPTVSNSPGDQEFWGYTSFTSLSRSCREMRVGGTPRQVLWGRIQVFSLL